MYCFTIAKSRMVPCIEDINKTKSHNCACDSPRPDNNVQYYVHVQCRWAFNRDLHEHTCTCLDHSLINLMLQSD